MNERIVSSALRGALRAGFFLAGKRVDAADVDTLISTTVPEFLSKTKSRTLPIPAQDVKEFEKETAVPPDDSVIEATKHLREMIKSWMEEYSSYDQALLNRVVNIFSKRLEREYTLAPRDLPAVPEIATTPTTPPLT